MQWIKAVGVFSVVTVEFVGFSIAGIGLGYLAWKKWDWPWWALLVFGWSGLALGVYRLFQLSKRELRASEKNRE